MAKCQLVNRNIAISIINIFVVFLLFHLPNYYAIADSDGLTVGSNTETRVKTNNGFLFGINPEVGDQLAPDLFTGSVTYSIPIDVPIGRNGMKPNITLSYRSSNGNGWVGMGWELEMGAIERNTRYGVDYSKEDYLLRQGGGAKELVKDANNNDRFYGKMEGGFERIIRRADDYGKPYWEVTTKDGKRFFYGRSMESRQDDPSDMNHDRIFKWCLDRIEDTNGNYINLFYAKDRGQIYLDRIEYTGSTGVDPTNVVKFYKEEGREDAFDMFIPNFRVNTAYRLKSIDIISNWRLSNQARVSTYKLLYRKSTSSNRQLLTDIFKYGKDASVDTDNGTILNEAVAQNLRIFSAKEYYDIDGNSFNPLMNPSGLDNLGWYKGNTLHLVGDFDGNGKTDVLKLQTDDNNLLLLANGNGSFHGYYPGSGWLTGNPVVLPGDFTGDGKTDVLTINADGTNKLYFPNGNGFSSQTNRLTLSPFGSYTTFKTGDFDGDGKTDILRLDATSLLYLSSLNFNSTLFTDGAKFTADFNGDGKTDIFNFGPNETNYLLMSNGDGSFNKIDRPNGIEYITYNNYSCNISIFTGDFNGDGKADFLITGKNNDNHVYLSNGNGTFTHVPNPAQFNYGHDCQTVAGGLLVISLRTLLLGDFNGDGKADVLRASNDGGNLFLSKGDGTFLEKTQGGEDLNDINDIAFLVGDYNGDGKADVLRWKYNGTNNYVHLWGNEKPLDALVSFENALGARTTFEYAPSTSYTPLLITQYPYNLPFPLKTISAVTTNDGNGNDATTRFFYSGGNYYAGERDFRGFNYVKVTGPGPNGEQRISETWFHQGNDIAVDVNNPNALTGYMKGKPYRTRVSDGGGNVYSDAEITYADKSVAPYYFNPLLQVDTYSCNGGSSDCKNDPKVRHTFRAFDYDMHGNTTREEQHGNVANPADVEVNKTIVTTFSDNENSWIIGLPINETVYQGIGTTGIAPNSKVKQTDYYYDGVTDCTTASTNQIPTLGNLTRVLYWNDRGTNLENRMAYDSYGNPACSRDANGNITTFQYDGTFTFLKTTTTPLIPPTVVQYYGVDNVPADTGLFGQVKNVTDPNGASITMKYDSLGRKTYETQPDGFWEKWSYPDPMSVDNTLGIAGSQHVRVDNSLGPWSESYFDGLGRTIKERGKGPDNKVVVSEAKYDQRGAVTQTSLPYFEGIETPRYTTFAYEPMGRVTQATNPDATRVLACYDEGITVSIDPNNHRKRMTRDVLGRLVQVQEYTGLFNSCTTEVGTPYATTTYQYDSLGNLRFVTDAKSNQTEMRYDSLGRKHFMHDPDMGDWNYTYYPDGSLETQTDAKGQRIRFGYDELNRLRTKDYGADNSAEVTYTYDEPTSTYPLGRLTTMSDESGITKYYYDARGRTVKTVKTVDGTSYTIEAAYDGLDRINTLKYPGPDYETVIYEYDNGGNIYKAGNYATFRGYNALGQPGYVIFGNGVNTDYTYYPLNNRLNTITITKPDWLILYVRLTYGYDNKGNINSITDTFYGTPTGTLPHTISSQSYTPYPGKAHAFRATSAVEYDANGNMTSDGQRTIAYNFENMPRSINNINFVYDGTGSRVKKITPQYTVTYLDKLYECVGGVCGKYIFAGDQRIALKTAGKTLYYHTDHQVSTAIEN